MTAVAAATGLVSVPRAAFVAVAALGIMMGVWIIGPFPGSAWAGLEWRDSLGEFILDRSFVSRNLNPLSGFLKYGRAPALLHALPGAGWCAIAPFQLSRTYSTATQTHAKAYHRRAGQVMLAFAAILMLGFEIIDQSGLNAEDTEYKGHTGRLSAMLGVSPLGKLLPMSSLPRMVNKSVALWFVWTGLMTFVKARSGKYRSHGAWAVRHVGAGLWIAGQRLIFLVYRLLQLVMLGPDRWVTPLEQADAFYNSGYIAQFVFFSAAEAIARGAWAGPTTATLVNVSNGGTPGIQKKHK